MECSRKVDNIRILGLFFGGGGASANDPTQATALTAPNP